ncbi:MAG: diguanylate cyclase [Planctomycetota bacterium]|jgi:diguanylate cyclase (GGDEF)-like protein|nr:diguanylate cyclase [Planctomycetota bacterium]MDP6989384.1 diguanylate cyclase [Planctomycetota bacterium]
MSQFPSVNFTSTGRGLFSTEEILELMRGECDRARRYAYPLVLLRVCVDRLEQLGDLYGYESRERVLEEVGGVLCSVTRESDMLGCIIDSQFLALFPHTPAEAGRALAERLTQAAGRLAFHQGVAEVKITLSVGIALREAGVGAQLEELFSESAQSLELALAAGGNRAEVYSAPARSLTSAMKAVPADLEEIGAMLDSMLSERVQAMFESVGQKVPDFGGHEQEVLARAVKKMEEERELLVSQHREEMDTLSRRMEKLAEGLEITEEELRQALAHQGFDPGVASLYRTVQGLGAEDADEDLKRAMMSKIFEANLELKEERGEAGQPG